jgi:hypothetical protein
MSHRGSNPLPSAKMWVCWGDWLPYRAVNSELFGALRVRILPHPPELLFTRGCSLNGESSRLSIEQMPVRIRLAAPDCCSGLLF